MSVELNHTLVHAADPWAAARWADPHRNRPGEINHHDGGRGLYWAGPDGHWLEIITRPYGSGGEVG